MSNRVACTAHLGLGVEGELGSVREPIAVCPVLLGAGCIEGNKVHSGLSQHISTTNEHLSHKEKSLVGIRKLGVQSRAFSSSSPSDARSIDLRLIKPTQGVELVQLTSQYVCILHC